jgi:hypothetical protein
LVLAALKSISTIKRALALSISNRMIRFWRFYDNSFFAKCPVLKHPPKIKHCANIVLYLGSAITLTMMNLNGYPILQIPIVTFTAIIKPDFSPTDCTISQGLTSHELFTLSTLKWLHCCWICQSV